MPTGGTASIAGSAAGTTRTTIFSETSLGFSCSTFAVSNRSTSAGPVYVVVTGMHNATEGLALGPGVSWPLKKLTGGISTVQIYGDGTNAATVDYGVLVR